MASGMLSGARTAQKHPYSLSRLWHVVDAKGHVVGRLASQVATLLMGKYKPIWDPSVDCGDYVVIKNAEHVQFTGRKWDKKLYRWHTGYPGGLKERAAKVMLERNPEKILRHAIMGMIPKNRLKKIREGRLKIYVGDKNPHQQHISSSLPSINARNIPANVRTRDYNVDDEKLHHVGGQTFEFGRTSQGLTAVRIEKIKGFKLRAKERRRIERGLEVGEDVIYDKPKHQEEREEDTDFIPHDFGLPEKPTTPLRNASDKLFSVKLTPNMEWDWPKVFNLNPTMGSDSTEPRKMEEWEEVRYRGKKRVPHVPIQFKVKAAKEKLAQKEKEKELAAQQQQQSPASQAQQQQAQQQKGGQQQKGQPQQPQQQKEQPKK
jgi:large subunit ribosomal protein L13